MCAIKRKFPQMALVNQSEERQGYRTSCRARVYARISKISNVINDVLKYITLNPDAVILMIIK